MRAAALFLLLWAPQLALADDGGGEPLACMAQQTFFPAGYHWALAPNGSSRIGFVRRRRRGDHPGRVRGSGGPASVRWSPMSLTLSTRA